MCSALTTLRGQELPQLFIGVTFEIMVRVKVVRLWDGMYPSFPEEKYICYSQEHSRFPKAYEVSSIDRS